MTYNWQRPDWPRFVFTLHEVEDALSEFVGQAGYLSGVLQALPEDTQLTAVLDTMVAEALKTSEIEGEYLSRQDVYSSIRNRLGLADPVLSVTDKKSKGAGELMADVRDTYSNALTEETLFAWHKTLMQANQRIAAGAWRTHTDPMQVVSGSIGRETVHFEAPPSSQVAAEMARFLEWFNETAPGGRHEMKQAPVRSAVAHLYFETIHPFEDGNGRIGRAVAEKALSQTLGRPALLSLSQAIEADRKGYYAALEAAQRSNEITPWVNYFVGVVNEAQHLAGRQVSFILKKTKFFVRFEGVMNGRQEKVIRRMLEAGPGGFEGGMTANKYISITKTSKATATRDLQELVELGILVAEGGGRSTHYAVVL